METAHFVSILQQFTESSLQDAQAVLQLKHDFPYSQVLHVLAARVSKDHGFSISQEELQLAAVYSSDRSVLKQIMLRNFAETPAETKASVEVIAPTSKEEVSTPANDVAKDIIHDLKRLQQLRQNFELMFVDDSATSMVSFTPVMPVENHDDLPPAEIPKENLGTEYEAIQEPSAISPIKAKKERIKELAKAYNPVTTPATETTTTGRRRLKKKELSDSFIEDIVVSKDEITPDTEKHKEQIEIIDHFIRLQPSIHGLKDKDGNLADLSTIKSGDFGDHIISETLVEILVKQGKKEKAVEVLKKLIWKFPQKKTYFAAQIEELKK